MLSTFNGITSKTYPDATPFPHLHECTSSPSLQTLTEGLPRTEVLSILPATPQNEHFIISTLQMRERGTERLSCLPRAAKLIYYKATLESKLPSPNPETHMVSHLASLFLLLPVSIPFSTQRPECFSKNVKKDPVFSLLKISQ